MLAPLIHTLLLSHLLAIQAGAPPSPIVLVWDGRPASVVVLPDAPERFEKMAAEELVRFVRKMSGAELPVLRPGEISPQSAQSPEHPNGKEGRARILIGRAAQSTLRDLNVNRALGPRRDNMSCRDGYVIRAGKNTIALAGVRHTGTLYATYDLLERLGYRWFFASELGEVVPRRRTVAIDPFETVEVPSFDMRTVAFSGWWGGAGLNMDTREDLNGWSRRNRLSLDYHIAVQALMPRVDLNDPRHVEAVAQQLMGEIQLSPKQTLKNLQINGFTPLADELTLGLREPWHGARHVSDPLYRFYNRVVEKVEPQFPGRLYGTVVHGSELAPPLFGRPHRSIVPALGVSPPCAIHPSGTGRCWRRDVLLDSVRSWCAVSPNIIFYDSATGFSGNVCVPLPLVTRMRVEFPAWHRAGVRGRYCYTKMSVMNNGPNVYIRARLFWDANADVDALLHDYFRKLFGPAARPARAWWDGLNELIQSASLHARTEEVMKVIFPLERIMPLEQFVREAERRANSDVLRRRVRMIRFSYKNLMLYLRMRDAEDLARFDEAAKLARRLWTLHEKIESVNPYFYKIGDMMLNGEDYPHMALGWAKHNLARHELTDGTVGDEVADLADEWLFRTDPHNEGHIWRWFERDLDTSAWAPIRTTRFWENQGGTIDADPDRFGWYRTRIVVPDVFAGRPIRLNFGGVSGRMMIWMNGTHAGSRGFRVSPWPDPPDDFADVDVTAAIEPGVVNTIVIRVHNRRELSGIHRRVLLWSPKAG